MKIKFIIILPAFILLSCAPVLRHDLLQKGIFDINLSEIKQNPSAYREELFILGGIIVQTTVTKDGSLIEAIYVPADSMGYLKNVIAREGRFLAVFKGRELLDPLIFREKREVTIACRLIGSRTGMIGEMEYVYPLFEIEEIYLWPEKIEKEYYYLGPPYYPPWYYRHNYYNPWWYY